MKSDNINRKFIESYSVSDYEIWTDTGWEDIDYIHKTIPYECWTIKTELGKKLSGADNHIVFDENGNEIFLKDIQCGDKILTKDGAEKIIYVHNDNKKENMYDISINSEGHRFYSNDILSHNSTSYTVYCLWYILTHKQKNILICANKFKTAKDILARIRLAYTKLPNWLKPGIITWSASEVVFDNGCKITAESTSENSGRSGSINVLILDEFAFVPPGCVGGNTEITLKHTNGNIFVTSIEKAETLFKYSDYMILTQNGYKPFSNIVKRKVNAYYELKFQNVHTNKVFTLQMTGNHRILIDNEYKKIAYVESNTMVTNSCKLISKKRLRKQLYVYDILDIKDTNSFITTDNICLHNCEEGFLNSVMPVVSSSKTSQIIIVSTPQGMNNEYYRIWNRAQLDLNSNSNDLKWTPVRIDWYDVPGRDEKWKQEQLLTFNGNMKRFLQEYGCSFSGSVETLINSDCIEKYKKRFQDNNFKIKPSIVQLHKDYPKTSIYLYKAPEKNHAYICGADPSAGAELDYQAMSIWDITNPLKIELVASFYENDIPPKIFAYIIAKSATLYNMAYVAMESNGVSYATLSALIDIFEYENICHIGGNPKTSIGIHSNADRKLEACLNFKEICESPFRDIYIYDGRLIDEMEQYERMSRPGKSPLFGNRTGHDDLMTSAIWAFYIIKPDILEQYYDIKKYVMDRLGNSIPSFVITAESQENINNALNQMTKYIDDKFSAISNKNEITLNQLEMSITQSQKNIMENFLLELNDQNINKSDNDDNESFIDGFIS